MADVFDVAQFFININLKRESDELSALRLFHVLYLAQGLSLADRSEPLFAADFEAWEAGPVIPAVYQEFSKAPIEEQEPDFSRFSSEEIRLLFDVDMLTKDKTTSELVALANTKEGPWREIFASGQKHRVIPKQMIDDYFSREVFKEPNQRCSDRLVERIPLGTETESFR